MQRMLQSYSERMRRAKVPQLVKKIPSIWAVFLLLWGGESSSATYKKSPFCYTLSMKNLKIRNANKEDIPNIEKGLRASWDMHSLAEPELFDLERIKSSNVQKSYEDALSNDESFILVAEENDEFVGFIKADIEVIPHWFSHNKTFWLDDIYINEDYRRKGTARKLIKEVEKEAKKRGIKRIQARIYKFNRPMQNLLISLGYDFPHMTANKLLL